ncbi:carboxypeptidase B [Lepeophtheirus salmonis]|uniref:carboxypeptidase B n=1 Tax=Lepeophtheirus salmonis TaxID=72036 RepID=UPI001AE665E0|nr:carboxypeptidase B-like [Lepeophtheirus salmonis]
MKKQALEIQGKSIHLIVHSKMIFALFFNSSMNWKHFQNIDVIHDFLYETARINPSIASVFSIGKSYEGRDLLILKVGTPSPQGNIKPAIFIEGGIHAREWISPAATTYMIKEFVFNYKKNKEILEAIDLYILPVMNPDGYAYTFRKDRLWRKSRSRNGGLLGSILPACVGVDLNRNFGYKWLAQNSLLHARGGSSLSCLETYAGTSPFSEPETRALGNFLLGHRDIFQAYLSIHSFGQKVTYPWSYTKAKVKDWKDLHQMGNIIANTISKYSGVDAKYDVGTSSEVQYRSSGGADDFAKGALGIKWVYLIELPDRGRHGFLLPANLINPVSFSVFQGIREFARRIAKSQFRGQ